MKKIKGFTLIELIIVTAIIGMLALGGYPVLKSLKKDRHLKSEAELIVSNLNFLRYLAVSEGTNYILRFQNDGKHYTLEKESNGSILREHNFEGSVVLDFSNSQNMIEGSQSSYYILVTSSKGILSGLIPQNNIRIALVSGENSVIYVKIVPGREATISWTP
jgi:prepilin-type N-terminal cleavage/methylation domain-containing protein